MSLTQTGKWAFRELAEHLEDGEVGLLKIKIGEGGVQWIQFEPARKYPPKREGAQEQVA